MSRLSRVIVLDDESRSRKTLAFGFERESVHVVTATSRAEASQRLAAAVPDVMIVSLEGAGSCDLVREVRARPAAAGRVPVLVLGALPTRRAALNAGASEFLSKPTLVRDVVTLSRVLCLRPKNGRASGELSEFPGMFHLVRALSASMRTGVLTFVRGLRRGEIRFHEGEVTSADVGALHGLAAFHQLLLWTEGRFELRDEAVVRRQQIPLQPRELFDGGARFLHDFAQMAQDLTPSSIFEQDLRRAAECVDKIPKEVGPVLRLFDGTRSVADIVEDSPFRVSETLNVVHRLVELGAVRKLSSVRSRTTSQAALAVGDDWMVGGTAPGRDPAAPIAELADGDDPTPPSELPTMDAHVLVSGATPSEDWTIPTPLVSQHELASFAPVVPSQSLSGEIKAVRDTPRPSAPNPADEPGISVSADATTPMPGPPAMMEVAPPEPAPAGSAPAVPVVQAPVLPPPAVPLASASPQGSAAGRKRRPSQPGTDGVDGPFTPPPDAVPTPMSSSSTASGAFTVRASASTPSAVDSKAPQQTIEIGVGTTPAGLPPVRTSAPTSPKAPGPVAPAPVAQRTPAAAKSTALSAPSPVGDLASSVSSPAASPQVGRTTGAVGSTVAPSRRVASTPGVGDVAQAVKPAGQFSEVEEEFFSEEKRFEEARPSTVESFDDLDDGYEPPPPPLWKRLLGAKPPPPRRRPAAGSSRMPVERPPGASPAGTSSRGSNGTGRTGKPGNKKRR